MPTRCCHLNRALAAIALLLVVPSAVSASRADDGVLSVELGDDLVGTFPSQNATTEVRLRNAGLSPMIVALSAVNATGAINVTFDAREVSVLPGAITTTQLTVRGPSVGEWIVDIVARERSPLGGDGTHTATATLAVVIAALPANATDETGREVAIRPVAEPKPQPRAEDAPAPAPEPSRPPPPARLFVASYEIDVARGESAPILVRVENPASVAQRFDLTLELPLGWDGALLTPALEVPAGASADARASVTPGKNARDGSGSLRFAGAGGKVSLPLSMRVADPAPEPAPAAEDAPPVVVDAPPQAPSPRAPATEPTIRVQPSEIGARRGTSVVVTLFIANPGDAPLAGIARVGTAPLAAKSHAPEFLAPPHDEAVVSFTITIPDEVAEGTAYEGVATTSIGAARVPFTVRIESAEPAPIAPSIEESAPLWPYVAAGVGVGALGLVLAWRRWPALGLLALYARFRADRALEHPRRAALVALLRSEPGLTLADVQRRMGMSNGVARHHVDLLEAAGIVRTVPDGTLRRLWPVGEPARAVPPLRERVTDALGAGPMRSADLAQRLGVSKQALHYHVKRLLDEHKIVAVREQNELVLRRA